VLIDLSLSGLMSGAFLARALRIPGARSAQLLT
jgi:hypothetical protein